MTLEELQKQALPCPFCGSTNIKYFGTNGDNVYCRTCEAEGPRAIDGKVETALLEWNKRINNSKNNPCSHPGCRSHITHPCEKCGRQWGKKEEQLLNHIKEEACTERERSLKDQ